MQDARGDVLYVGKARVLKNRVTNYTQVAKLPKRLQRMVSQTRSMTIVTTRTEAEALLLEAQLIKRFRPAYNVLLRDDKSFPFILLREDHEFPRIQKHRGARRIKGQYYGPFASAGSVTRTLNALAETIPAKKLFRQLFREPVAAVPALPDQALLGAVRGAHRRREYGELVGEAKEFLAGKSIGVQSRLSKQMARSRRAARLRAGRSLSRPAASADLYPGQPDGACGGARRRRRLRPRVQGRHRLDPGLLHPRRAELGASRLLSGAYQ